MSKEWHNLSNADAALLEDAIDQREEYLRKLAIFRSGLIPPDQRWLQTNAHEIYDQLSMRELSVFEMRTLQHTFPVIAEGIRYKCIECKDVLETLPSKMHQIIYVTERGK